MDVDDGDKRALEVERMNEELLKNYQDGYRNFRNEALSEIQQKVEAEFETEKRIHERKVDEVFARRLEEEKTRVESSLEQDYKNEMEKATAKELRYAERRKEADCKKWYSRIKNEITRARETGQQVIFKCFFHGLPYQ